MFEFNGSHKSVLERCNKPIVHMRKQVDANRFGLIFGAGLSEGCDIPTWRKLVEALAKDPEVQGEDVLQVVPPRAGLPYQTEMLFEHFKHQQYDSVATNQHNTRALDYRIGADWRELIRKHLYGDVSGNLGDLLDEHPYLKQYLPIISRTHMTVTYNFDDFLEQSLSREHGDGNASSRGFESVTNPWMQFRRTNAVIYHPNGAVPQNQLETPSDRFVFSEASYVKQLMGIFAGDQAGLVSHLSKHTCLLIGLSLEDDMLRNVLLQAAHSCPGNFHYYIHYLKPGETLNNDTQRAITLANFKVYNLVTLFLNDAEICALGELINIGSCPSNEFCDFAEQHEIQVRFRFYVTGALGVGKSTAINQFRNLVVLDEWLEQRPLILAKSWVNLTDDEKNAADEWIINQFKVKNDILRNEREGIIVLDRGPLDPVAFTPDVEWSNKAARLLSTICPGQAQWQVEDGRVILMQGEGSELALRMVMTQREEYTAEKLQSMEERLYKAYCDDGVTKFDTRGLTPSDVARRVAEIIHLEPYAPTCNLHNRLDIIRKEGFNVND
ncbi:MAG: SIR2 family protein [Thermodesulfobacteriota bacterium]